MAPRSVRFGVLSGKLSNVGQPLDGLPQIFISRSSVLRKALGLRKAVGPGCVCSR
jgi:hypothetical protein